jgi:hypothetical protein
LSVIEHQPKVVDPVGGSPENLMLLDRDQSVPGVL